MNGAPGWRRGDDDPPGRLTLRARVPRADLVFAGVTVERLARPGAAWPVVEDGAGTVPGTTRYRLGAGGEGGVVEARAWWLLESRAGLYAPLQRDFDPGPGGQLVALVLMTLLGLPGMPGLLRRWHEARTR